MTYRSILTNSHVPAETRYETPEDEVEINLGEILRILRRRIGVFVGCVLLVTSIVLLVTFQLTPLYTATALVLIDPRENNVTDLGVVVSGLSPESSTVESQVEVIRSRSLVTPLIEALQLDRDPEFNPALRERSALASALNWVTSLVPGQVNEIAEKERREREEAEVSDAFSDALNVARLGRLSFVISISFTSEDAVRAAQVANALADRYLVAQLEAKFEATRHAADWLDERLAPLREQVQESERVVEVYRSEHNLGDHSRGTTINEQQVLEVNRQLMLVRADLAEKQARFNRLNQLLSIGGGAESVAEVLESNVVADLRQQQAELARKQADLSSRYGERHPMMINVRAEQKDLQRELAAEVSRIVANLENEVAVAQSRDRSLTQSLWKLQGETSKGEQASIRLRELQREASANRAVYETFLSRFKETVEQQGIEQADARIISEAAVPVRSSFPNKLLSAVLGFAMSILIGLGVALLLERLEDNCFRTDRQLESQLQIPHLGSVPELKKELSTVDEGILSPADYILTNPHSSYAEAFQSLRAKLLLSDVPPRLILLTSALQSEGKTTTAISLGRAAARAGSRVLLIDADIRHCSVAKTLGHRPTAGLVEYLAGMDPLHDVLILDEPSGMQILPAKSGAANPPDLLGSAEMRDLLKKTQTDFDLVLIDSPPVLPVADAAVLSRFVDKVVFVVRWGGTPRRAVQDALHALREFDAEIAGAVFSRLDMQQYASYGYGHYYYGQYSEPHVN